MLRAQGTRFAIQSGPSVALSRAPYALRQKFLLHTLNLPQEGKSMILDYPP
jgi:hypothetical protein